MPQELLYLRQLFGNSGHGWLQVTLLGFLFLVLIFKPDRIVNRSLFRIACFLFALSVILPPLVTLSTSLLAGDTASSYSRSRAMMSGSPLMMSLSSSLGPVLFGISALCGLLSLIPDRERQNQLEVTKHPLE